MSITFTQAACSYIKKRLEKEDGIGFRLTIKKTGCSGFSYVPAIIKTINPSDMHFQVDQDITVFIDTTWLHLLEGLQVDFIEEEKAGLKQKRLVFTNPNESGRCGCGESFHAEQ